MISLLKRQRVCLCSGRARHHYVGLQKHYTGDFAFPWYLVAEFGAEVMLDGATILTMAQDPALAMLEESLRCWATERCLPIDDDEGECLVEGICFELKRQALDIDWDLGNPELNDRLFHDLTNHLPAMIGSSRLRWTAYHLIRRITVCPSGFLPKVSIWPQIRKLLGTPRTIWVVGDEQLDFEMAGAIQLSWPGSQVLFASTHPRVSGNVQLSCGIEAIEFIERILGQ
jgi:hypothetical protein